MADAGTWYRWRVGLPPLLVLALLGGCGGDPGTGPVDVKWDRDSCARCNMVLSDRQHAAQVRYRPGEDRAGVVRKFDDLGCAVLWLDQQPWRNDNGVEIWVRDRHSGAWIDARTAHFLPGQLTPMQYGLGAQSGTSGGTLDFARAVNHIYEIERRFNVHGGKLEHREPPVPMPEIAPAGTGRQR